MLLVYRRGGVFTMKPLKLSETELTLIEQALWDKCKYHRMNPGNYTEKYAKALDKLHRKIDKRIDRLRQSREDE